jgi:LmbE family N-acetylglucosaminyl deacetylase
MRRTLLACFAHPDDEAFGVSGLLAHYARQGVRVVLVCATRGEEGEISDPNLAVQEKLGQVREAEMRCAAETIGAEELIFLDYRDSGMAGTAANGRPDAFTNAPAGEVVPHLVGIIRRLQPDVVITFEPFGGYGHPDHIAIHHHTVAAFHAAADGEQYPEQGTPWQATRLFYTVILRSQLQKMAAAIAEAGVADEGFGDFLDNLQWPEDQVHLAMDVGDTIDIKWRTILCHRTQVGEHHPFRRIPEAKIKEIMRTEHLALAWPIPEPGLALAGLFAG